MKIDTIPQMRAIALNVWRESLRNRMLLVMAASGILMMFFSLILGRMAVGGQQRVVQNMGFWILGIWGLISVGYLGANIVGKEIQQKTIYLILSRPVSRTTFISGKFAGTVMVLTTAFVLLASVWLLLVKLQAVDLTLMYLWALIFIWGEWILLASVSLFFATFTSPMLIGFFLTGIYFLGHWSRDLYMFAVNAKGALIKTVLKLIYFLIPNLEVLNFREAAIYGESVSVTVLLEGAAVLIGWIVVVLVSANLIFSRRKLL